MDEITQTATEVITPDTATDKAAEANQTEAPKPPPERTYTHAEYAGMQRELQKAKNELANRNASVARLEALEAKIDSLNAKIGVLAEPEPDDLMSSGVQKGRKDRLAEIDAQVSAKTEQAKRVEAEFRDAQAELNEIASDSGLDLNDAKFKPAMDAWASGDFRKAVREARKVGFTILREPAKQTKADIEAEAERLATEKARARMKVDMGGTSGGAYTFTDRQIAEMSTEEYAKRHEEIDEAFRAGRVKKTA